MDQSIPTVSPLRDTRGGNALKVGDELVPLDTPRADQILGAVAINAKQAELSLGFTMEINVVRSERQHCPSCGARRVLYHLAAWVKGQPAGAGNALCARCAGFRAGSGAHA